MGIPADGDSAARPSHHPEPCRSGGAEVRRLTRDLPGSEVFHRLRRSERRADASEREKGFYLLEVKRRQLYRNAGCSRFRQFVRLRTGIPVRKATELVRAAEALEALPLMDAAFARGELHWSAVRAMIAVATTQTDKHWVDFALGRTVDEVERRVAACRAGDDPREPRMGGAPVLFPYHFNVPAEVHQAIESLVEILSRKTGEAVTALEAIFEAVKGWVGVQIAENEARVGKDKFLPSSYRLVIHRYEDTGRWAAATPSGPVEIPAERALELLVGAEVLDVEETLRKFGDPSAVAQAQPGPVGPAATERAAEHAAGRSLCPEKAPARVNSPSQIVLAPCSPPEGPEPAATQEEAPSPARASLPTAAPDPSSLEPDRTRGNEPLERSRNGASLCPEKAPARVNLASQAVLAPQSLVEHADDLSTPDKPSVPPRERDLPTPPELLKLVLSRDGYFCRIPGCGGIADRGHHVVYRSQGGSTEYMRLVGLDGSCHDDAHAGLILLSGTSDKLLISGRDRKPLVQRPSDEPTAVVLEVDPRPAPDPLGEPAAVAALPLPDEVTPAWWRQHQSRFEWSQSRGMLVFHPEGELEAGGTALPPPPAPPPGEGLEGFLGQGKVVQNLALLLKGARLRGEVPSPVLISGPPGLGKTTLARRAAVELGTPLHATTGPALQDLGALVGLLSSLTRNAVLFIDEVHGVPVKVAECLYGAIDHGVLSLPVAVGAGTRVVKLEVERFFLIGATTDPSLLPRPFHSRFTYRERLDLYSREELAEIARERGRALGVEVEPGAAERLARGSRGTPRELLANLRRARDWAQVERGRAEGVSITEDAAARSLELQGIDPNGLWEMDRKLLRLLHARGRPLGLRTVADLLGEDPRTVLEIHEPYLLREGYLARTRHGRVITEKGRRLFRCA